MQDYKVVDLLCTEDGYFLLLSYPSGYQLSIRSSGEKILGITTKVDKRTDKVKRFCIWCGRFSVPFGVDFLHRLIQCLRIQPLNGYLLLYGTNVSLGELPIRNLGLGSTAPSNLYHCVGYCAMGFR